MFHVAQGFGIFLFLLVTEISGDQIPAFDRTEVPSATCPDWMSLLPDHLPLSILAIPGTHNTMSFYGGNYAECQSWRLHSQYEAGIRFLDIRCRHYKDRLPIHHGISYQRTDFTQVLNDTILFLKEHTTETVLMRVKEEYKPYQTTRSFYKSVGEVVTQVGEHWFLMTSRLPTLGEARGKIIILQEFSSNGEGPDYGPSYPGSMSISDVYQVNDDAVKWEEVLRHLSVAQNGDPDTAFLTYISGVHWLFYTPEVLARKINPRVYDYLKEKTSSVGNKRTVGIVIMDFPGAELVREIILDNWK